MKKLTPLFVIVTCAFSHCYAQRGAQDLSNLKMESSELLSDNSNSDMVVSSYHVKEIINMTFGGSITTYDVSNINLVATYDLGENNVRVVTPKYGKPKEKEKEKEKKKVKESVKVAEKAEEKPVIKEPLKTDENSAAAIQESARAPIEAQHFEAKPINFNVDAAKAKKKYVMVDILSTYERVLDKGYKSVDMLKRVANNRFFDGDLTLAAKWYDQLFSMTKDLEPVFYYRYAQSLKSINQDDKAREMMEVFEKNKDL